MRLKPTSSALFPEIPAHWSLLSLRRVITQAVDGPHISPTYLEKGIPFLSARNVKADRWSLKDAKYISEEDYDEFCKRVRPGVGDVLYTKGGTTGVARAVDLEFPFQVWVHIAVLKLRREVIDSHYLAAALNSPRCYEQAQLLTRGATNQDLGLGRMKDILLPVPPLSEQRQIISGVSLATKEMLSAISAAQQEISLLREYRTRLVADVVTGKLDVRAALAEEPGDRESLEITDELEDDADDSGDAEDAPEGDEA